MKYRQFEMVRFRAEDLAWFYPHEIIDRLEALARGCRFDLDTEPREAVAVGDHLDSLDILLEAVIVPAVTGVPIQMPAEYARLPEATRRHFAYLLYSARQAARLLRDAQPETPLGTPKGSQGVYSNLLSASWIDLTEGGKIPVVFEPID